MVVIRLTRTAKPAELTDALQKELTDLFKTTGDSVWNKKWLKDRLLSFSNKKCCYCEANISEESKYMEVEHYFPKQFYKDDVLEWENLLPSCKKCNGTKGMHDTKAEPIIDPTLNDPRVHLTYRAYRLKGKDDLGKMTISVLDLNNADRLVKKRFEVGNAIEEKLEELCELIDEYKSAVPPSTKRKNRIINGTKGLLREGSPSSSYSATVATAIMTSPEYLVLKAQLTHLGFWDSELIQLETDLATICL